METNNITKPLVSVSTITYNHAKFIRKCIEGVLNQKVDFLIEYLIHDDCSTDGTIDIIKEYAEKYPNIIKPIYEKENQYSKGGPWGSAVWNYPRAQGKYIALCEGDDYWTDPLKLQKQVDFLESNPDYTCCFHCYLNNSIYTNNYYEPDAIKLIKESGNPVGLDLDVDLTFKRWVTMPMSQMMRKDALDLNLVYKYKYYRDTHEVYHLLKEGKGYLFGFVGGIRIMHEGGVASMISNEENINNSLKIAEELYKINNDEFTRKYYVEILYWALSNEKAWSLKRILYSTKEFLIDKRFWWYLKNIVRK